VALQTHWTVPVARRLRLCGHQAPEQPGSNLWPSTSMVHAG